MNEQQTAQLAELLKVAIKDIKKDIKYLGRKLPELRLLKEKKQGAMQGLKFVSCQQKATKSTLTLMNMAAALDVQNVDIQTAPNWSRGLSATSVAMINDSTAPECESKELDMAKLMMQKAELRLITGDIVGAATLMFKSQRLVMNESSRLTMAALGKKAAKQKKTQDGKHSTTRRVMEWVQSDWENDPNRLTPPRAAPFYADRLAEKGWVNPETGEVWVIPTIIEWLRDRAKDHKRATGNKLVSKRATKKGVKK